ncbi:methyltransferase domain-containing protein [Hysterangium stoloniferum]|nr:methyltransferase domain-containing protein [Hysterangium stoloniferum]
MAQITPGITLPPQFSSGSPVSTSELKTYVTACLDFLTSPPVSSILECHPNDISVTGLQPGWEPWWDWASAGKDRWKFLVPGWHQNPPPAGAEVPELLADMLQMVDSLALSRAPHPYFNDPASDTSSTLRGMSPKKSHEVLQMSKCLEYVLSQSAVDIKHVVDIGAGQGYLSRALSRQPFSMDVLALDFSEIQTKGAERRTANIEKKEPTIKNHHNSKGIDTTMSDNSLTGSITHEMVYINPQTLYTAVSRWIFPSQPYISPKPVLFVALHACGTLTPDILRCYNANRHKRSPFSPDLQQSWYAAALVVVGCCYNLMSPDSDFPLSNMVVIEEKERKSKLHLSYNHRSLAAQSPLQWTYSHSTRLSAELAIRKVVFRALLGKFTLQSKSDDHKAKESPIKIGRLPESAYSSFENFMTTAGEKGGIKFSVPDDAERTHSQLISCLEVLHTLRCRIGPVVESLILVDRYLYLTENAPTSKVLVLNLFEQELGSGRNVACIVLP